MNSNYKKIVDGDAESFLTDHSDMVVEGLVDEFDFDRNEIIGLDRNFHEAIMDRSYSVEDANWVIKNCENEETDSGLFESLDHDDALSAKAAYSFSNDVWSAAVALYDELKENVEEAMEKLQEEYEEKFNAWDGEGEAPDEPTRTTEIVQKVFDAYFIDPEKTRKYDIDSVEAFNLVKKWYELLPQVSRSGYSVGESYIDSRCGYMFNTPDYEYVQIDGEVATRIPSIRGKHKDEAIKILRESNTFFNDWVKRQELANAVQNAAYSDNYSEMVKKVRTLIATKKERK